MTSANLLVPMVSIQLNGDRHLCFNMNALRMIREEVGVDMLKDPMALDALPTDALVTVICAGLMHEDPELRKARRPGPARQEAIDTVGDWVHPGNLMSLLGSVMEALVACMPKADPEASNSPNVNRPSRSTGSTSGPVDGATLASLNGNSGA